MGSQQLNDMLGINLFDAAIYLALFVAVVMGFMSGLLRSLATIVGYLAAGGLAVALAPRLTPFMTAQFKLPPAQTWVVHGEPTASYALRDAIRERFGWRAEVPGQGQAVDLT